MKHFLLCTLFTLFASHSVIAAEVGSIELSDKVKIKVETLDGKLSAIPHNKMVSLKVTQSSPNLKIKLRAFDARMPAHGHGMVVKPKIEKLDDTSWVIKGVKLHMRGLWEMKFWFVVDSKDVEKQFEYVLK